MKLLIIFEFKRTTFRSEVQFTFVITEGTAKKKPEMLFSHFHESD